MQTSRTPTCVQVLVLATVLSACGGEPKDSATTTDDAAAAGSALGSWDDLPIEDHDVQGLKQLLDDKWTYFLMEMDQYNIDRDSANDDAMVGKMEYVFADSFSFAALNDDGTEFGTTQGTYSPRSWLEAQDVDSWQILHGTLLVPSYNHVLNIEEPGQRVHLDGYHEHSFAGDDIRIIYGEARELARETATFEKVDGVWRVTAYIEKVWAVSELTPDAVDPGPPD